ncbi:hypothetical protein A5876_002642, partial [Enterococcus sp. 3C8_DIV0646]
FMIYSKMKLSSCTRSNAICFFKFLVKEINILKSDLLRNINDIHVS